ncbi:MAG: mucoidy inhibitor MuiA family protein [Bacteroidales bacterium]|nr:mucoidy inhibitor MuiA family protein [Bacteroidales bacterium]
MKTITISVLLLSVSLSVSSQEAVKIESKITNVSLFPDRAQVIRAASVNIPQGKSLLRIPGLSPYIDPSSVQVEGEGDFMIVSVNNRKNYLEDAGESEEVVKLRGRIDQLKTKIEDERTGIEVLKEKESFLTANRLVTGKNENISAQELKSISDFYTSSIESVKKGILERSRLINKYEQEKQKLENQLSGTLRKAQMPTSEVIIAVTASSATRGRVNLSYLVTQAGWYPSYDIRVDDIDSDVKIFYKANAYQNTGNDWNNAKLSFSSASPAESGAVPSLPPYYLNFYSPVVPLYNKSARSMARPKASDMEEIAEMAYETEIPVTMQAATRPPVSISTTSTSFSFDVDIPQNIRSDGKTNTIELQGLTAAANYKYITIPKLREEAFLTADIPDWESLNLMNGDANIYFGNTFTGTTMLNTGQISDTLNVSLGNDNNITVKRERRKEYTLVRTIGLNRIDTRSFKISIRNNKSSEINIVLYDQLPVSQNKDIEVEATELSGASVNNISGEIEWDTVIPAGSTREFILSYTVKYPKNKKVILE